MHECTSNWCNQAIHRAMTKSESIDDIRSDTEEESEEYESSKKTK